MDMENPEREPLLDIDEEMGVDVTALINGNHQLLLDDTTLEQFLDTEYITGQEQTQGGDNTIDMSGDVDLAQGRSLNQASHVSQAVDPNSYVDVNETSATPEAAGSSICEDVNQTEQGSETSASFNNFSNETFVDLKDFSWPNTVYPIVEGMVTPNAPAQPGPACTSTISRKLRAKISGTKRKEREQSLPPQPQREEALTSAEKEKDEKRKERNRCSAKKSREEKKKGLEEMKKKFEVLNKQNSDLTASIEDLEKKASDLSVVKDNFFHAPSCPERPKLVPKRLLTKPSPQNLQVAVPRTQSGLVTEEQGRISQGILSNFCTPRNCHSYANDTLANLDTPRNCHSSANDNLGNTFGNVANMVVPSSFNLGNVFIKQPLLGHNSSCYNHSSTAVNPEGNWSITPNIGSNFNHPSLVPVLDSNMLSMNNQSETGVASVSNLPQIDQSGLSTHLNVGMEWVNPQNRMDETHLGLSNDYSFQIQSDMSNSQEFQNNEEFGKTITNQIAGESSSNMVNENTQKVDDPVHVCTNQLAQAASYEQVDDCEEIHEILRQICQQQEGNAGSQDKDGQGNENSTSAIPLSLADQLGVATKPVRKETKVKSKLSKEYKTKMSDLKESMETKNESSSRVATSDASEISLKEIMKKKMPQKSVEPWSASAD